VSSATVAKWRSRFLVGRLDGLDDVSRPGAPRRITDEQVALAISKTLEERAPGRDALDDAVDGGGDGLELVSRLTDLAGGQHQAELSCLDVSYALGVPRHHRTPSGQPRLEATRYAAASPLLPMN
jgi:hypothetical protein